MVEVVRGTRKYYAPQHIQPMLIIVVGRFTSVYTAEYDDDDDESVLDDIPAVGECLLDKGLNARLLNWCHE